MRPFNIEEAKAGKPVQTRSGYPVRIICWDCETPDYPIVGLVTSPEENREYVETFTKDGKYNVMTFGDDSSNDLVMAAEHHVVYINLYRKPIEGIPKTGQLYSTMEEAKKVASTIPTYITTVKLEYDD